MLHVKEVEIPAPKEEEPFEVVLQEDTTTVEVKTESEEITFVVQEGVEVKPEEPEEAS